MYTKYRLKSAQEFNSDILDAIKATYKSRPITIVVEEDEGNYQLTKDFESILDERLAEDPSTYYTADESLEMLKNKYGL
jgi:hypothetical protein